MRLVALKKRLNGHSEKANLGFRAIDATDILVQRKVLFFLTFTGSFGKPN